MHRYSIVLRHAGGSVHISTTASSLQRAIEQVCEFEGAPISAVISATDCGPVYEEPHKPNCPAVDGFGCRCEELPE